MSKVSMKTSVFPSEGAALTVLEIHLILSRLEKTLHLSANFYPDASVSKTGMTEFKFDFGQPSRCLS